MTSPAQTSAVSFLVNVARLARGGLPIWLEADEEQRAALARDHGLLGVESYRLDATVTPWQGRGVKIAGTVRAEITQECAVTLDPVAAVVDERFEALFVPESSRLARRDAGTAMELVLDAEGPDAPETFSGDSIDVGAVGEEFFELAIDPYPRSPSAELAELSTEDRADDEKDQGGALRRELEKLLPRK